MQIILKSAIGASIAIVAAAPVAQAQQIPADSAVRIGRLDNGLMYYIRHNTRPEKQVNFYIAQRVGSINEEENQRGLAHFLEHMCFNGTQHFPGNSLITYLESVGVKFGANLNAYTSTDETVYNINNVPTARRTTLDSCFLILSDWSNGLLLKDKDIDEERGVIEGEWRYRSSAYQRIMEQLSPKIYGGSRYGERMPIGLMSVVKNFKYKALRDYYKKWYHPSNQAIIVVGDIDLDYAEAKIRELFAGKKNPKNAAPIEKFAVPENDTIICAVGKDKEQPSSTVQLWFKHADIPDSLQSTMEGFAADFKKQMVVNMLVGRFTDLEKDPDAPFTNIGVGDTRYFMANTQQAFLLRALVKKGREAEAVKWMEREVRRALLHGFTATEYARAKKEYLAGLDRELENKDKRGSLLLSRQYVRHYLSGTPIPSPETEHRVMNGIAASTSLADIEATLRSWVTGTDKNVAIVAFCPDRPGTPVPSEQSLVDAFHEARAESPAAYVDKVVEGPLLDKEPKAGKVVKVENLARFGAKVATLSNGVKVYYKQNPKAEDIAIAATGRGGYEQLAGRFDYESMKLLNGATALSGAGKFSSSDLETLLSGKDAKISTFVSVTEQGFSGKAAPADLETAFRLLYLKLTQPKPDEKAYRAFIEQNRTRLENNAANPRQVMGDSIFSIIYSHHPIAKKADLTTLKKADYGEIMKMYADRFGDVSGWNFYIVGNFNEDSLLNLCARYVASLPADGQKVKPKKIGYSLPNKDSRTVFEAKMENPQSVVYTFWSGKARYGLKETILADILTQALREDYLREIREKRGWTYSVRSHCSLLPEVSGGDGAQFFIPVYVIVAPENVDSTRLLVKQTFDDIARKGIPEATLLKAQKYLVKNAATDPDGNDYWLSMMKQYATRGIDLTHNYVKTVNSITSADVRDFAKALLKHAVTTEIIMNPEGKK